jgi:DNA-binding transcriptional ArsR family regulator
MPAATEATGELRQLIHIDISAPYELLISFTAAWRAPERLAAWVARATSALGAEGMAELRAFCDEMWHPLALLEFPVDYTGPVDDARDFIEYIARMPVETFLFYFWGRYIPPQDVAAVRRDPERLAGLVAQSCELVSEGSAPHSAHLANLRRSAKDAEAVQARLAGLLRGFYEAVFRPDLPEMRRRWRTSVQEQRVALAASDAGLYLSRLRGGRSIPRMVPAGAPLEGIYFAPSYFIWKPTMEVWGYGKLHVIYDARQTEERAQERDEAAEQLTLLAGALADPNRLKILSVIMQDDGAYGHKLARACGISQPAVSRHMGILKRAGLVDEAPRDGRTIYRLRRSTLDGFMPALLQYLES